MLDSLNGDERLDQNYIEHWVRELQLDRSVLSKRLANQTRRASNDEAWVGGKLEYNRRA